MSRYAKWTRVLRELPVEKEFIGSADLLKWLQEREYLQGNRARSSLNKWLKRQVDQDQLSWRMIYHGCRAEPRYRIDELIQIGQRRS